MFAKYTELIEYIATHHTLLDPDSVIECAPILTPIPVDCMPAQQAVLFLFVLLWVTIESLLYIYYLINSLHAEA